MKQILSFEIHDWRGINVFYSSGNRNEFNSVPYNKISEKQNILQSQESQCREITKKDIVICKIRHRHTQSMTLPTPWL
jgi:hypothetical protein